MYTGNDYSEAKSAMRNFIALYCAVAVILLGTAVLGMIIVDQDQKQTMQWLTYVSAALLVIVSLFLWGNFGVRLVSWNRFLREMKRGLERAVTGTVASIDEDENMKEGLEFRAVRILTGEESDKAGGRLLYVDASRFPIPAAVGQKVCCTVYGNYVKDIKVSEEK